MLAVEQKPDQNPTWVKVNMYGGVVPMCKDRLFVGCYVIVTGRLMNRERKATQDTVVEVRGNEIVFPRLEDWKDGDQE